jgi:hypothetical protein
MVDQQQVRDENAPLLVRARRAFHAALLNGPLTVDEGGIGSIADKGSKSSRQFALGLIRKLGTEVQATRLAGQMSGASFEVLVGEFLSQTFPQLEGLRCGSFEVHRGSTIDKYDQYAHLAEIAEVMRLQPRLKTALGADYLIKPDIVIIRMPESDEAINERAMIVDETVARLTSLRRRNNETPILHASISCKWTLRSDRAQNARSEALNLIRNRKGRLPHAVIITAEPTPNRIASLAMGTGDIDCVYHVALPELRAAIVDADNDTALELLDQMIDGKRLRDIGDLPLDLAI